MALNHTWLLVLRPVVLVASSAPARTRWNAKLCYSLSYWTGIA